MVTEKDFAALSAMACIPRCHEGAQRRSMRIPQGWSALPEATSNPEHGGLGVKAFVNDLGETVLAMGGLDFMAEAMVASNNAEEFITNLALDMGLASYTEALQRAAHAYALLRQRTLRQGEDPGPIHFTGHGVGGGMASVMATWFDQPCTVFAQAPLRAVALSPGDFASVLRTVESLLGSTDSAVKALQAFIRHPREVLAQREQLRVTHWHVRGEIHALLRSPATAIQGTENAIDIGIQPPSLETALTLHAMNLHAALLYEPRLSLLCQASPDLLFLMIDREEDCDLLETLIHDQHKVGLERESALTRFVNGLEWKGEVPAGDVLSSAAADQADR
jgi:hypothetical protein